LPLGIEYPWLEGHVHGGFHEFLAVPGRATPLPALWPEQVYP
jgi:hypothetical protein